MVNRSTAPNNISLSLKLVGIICIVSFFLDFLFLLIPFQLTDKLWQINLCRNLVDRGTVPMVGMAAILTAYWFDSVDEGRRPSPFNLKLPTFMIASLLGLIFLLIFPLHLNNVNQVKIQTLTRIGQEADQLENQVKNQLAQVQTQLGNDQVKAAVEKQRTELKQQLSTQLGELVKDEQKYNQALNNNQLPAAQKDLLKQYKTNPKALDDFISQQTDPQQLANQRITQVRSQKEQELKKTSDDAIKELRTGLSSLLLAIGYIIIGWTGLRSMSVLQSGSKRSRSAR
ncbi:MAG: HpsJ family protein [Cuspidothrix sp.]